VCSLCSFLYDLLTHPAMEDGPLVLVACNKSDVPGAKSQLVICDGVTGALMFFLCLHFCI
jgi:hypothetical protein